MAEIWQFQRQSAAPDHALARPAPPRSNTVDSPGLRVTMADIVIIHVMIRDARMPSVVTINRPEVVALIEEAANKLTGGNKTEAVVLALRRLLEQHARSGSLFDAHAGSVRVRDGVDLTVPALDAEPDVETGREVDR
jgi:hypothetical protein